MLEYITGSLILILVYLIIGSIISISIPPRNGVDLKIVLFWPVIWIFILLKKYNKRLKIHYKDYSMYFNKSQYYEDFTSKHPIKFLLNIETYNVLKKFKNDPKPFPAIKVKLKLFKNEYIFLSHYPK